MIQGRAGGNWEYEMSNKASDTLRKISLFKRSWLKNYTKCLQGS